MRCYYKTLTMEELAHKLSGAQHFSKLDAKNGYWSILLDEESQLLTTFHSPFERFCFRRMPFWSGDVPGCLHAENGHDTREMSWYNWTD